MHLLSDILVVLFSGYLALTNSLAAAIMPHFSFTDDSTPAETEIVQAESLFADVSIPRILLDSAPYQEASVIDGVLEPAVKASPLGALVNIFCSFTTKDMIRSTTGSGYFVHQNGVILTNAHVAQYLILEGALEGTGGCTIRTGNPAVETYTADLLYISPAWIQEHAALLKEAVPSGTGERDYALLYVTGRVDGTPMPATFPAIPVNTNLMKSGAVGAPVRAAGYPAEILASRGANAPLTGIEVGTTITELMTFGSNYADLFSIAGTEIGQQGSSGGPVADENGYAIGLISTRGDDTRFGHGSLRAISLSYVDRTIQEETGYTLAQNMGGDLAYRARIFRQTVVPFLQFLLAKNLE